VVDPAERAPRLAAHEDVLGDRQVGEERGLLVDHGDARVAGVGGTVEDGGLAVQEHLTGVRSVHAGERLDEGRLARAVLTGECVHFAGEQFQGHVPQGAYCAEGLRNVLERQHGGRTRVGPVSHEGSSTTRAMRPHDVVKGFN
jgi:hypothetical protein